MALMGRYFEVPEPLFQRRLRPDSSVNIYPEWRSRMLWFGNDYANKITLPHWMQLRHYLAVIVRTPNGLRTKLTCLAFMAVWVTRYNRWRSLAHDVVLAAQALLHRAGRRLPARR